MASQREWPRSQADGSEKRGPNACFQGADGLFKSNRDLAGPLRMGTDPKTGPKGGVIDADNSRMSDMGMDRVSPRDFDPIGTSRNRFGNISSKLIAENSRRSNGY